MKRILNPSFLSPSLLAKGTFAALGFTALVIAGAAPAVKASLTDSPKAVVDEVWQIVNNEFVGYEFNQDAWQAQREELLDREYRTQQDAYDAIRQALRDLGDPYTRFLSPREFQDLTNQTTGELSGVGVRLTVDEDAGVLTVVEPLEDTPASAAGLESGDRILRIDGKPTA
ncbi:MAG: PDZ domain-containing protein, partial [Spirulinaceae cyanobacterium RM2_2_10]|nr:PDZ domain-containing protein [Spirulinaceae cyanobacterium RM2_2_10]